MTELEKQEISQLPERYRPLSAWAYFGYSILFSLPLVGLIALIVFSFSNSNVNRRSFARSFFCGLVLALVLTIVVTVLAAVLQISITLPSLLS